mmetsp:Transcript_15794/g.34131  ORF Transcript_15794/g.34131 Transcript_15794/m.34131 type:complete len:145 (+) Transcript_15794:420-854(+)
MEEYQPLDSTIPSPTLDTTSVEECTRWIQTAGESGMYAMLGMRRTVGTVSRSLNNGRSSNQLIKACQKRHKPNSKSRLTVAARALAKHANRSISESKQSFYGTFHGSESEKKHTSRTCRTSYIKGGSLDQHPCVRRSRRKQFSR